MKAGHTPHASCSSVSVRYLAPMGTCSELKKRKISLVKMTTPESSKEGYSGRKDLQKVVQELVKESLTAELQRFKEATMGVKDGGSSKGE